VVFRRRTVILATAVCSLLLLVWFCYPRGAKIQGIFHAMTWMPFASWCIGQPGADRFFIITPGRLCEPYHKPSKIALLARARFLKLSARPVTDPTTINWQAVSSKSTKGDFVPHKLFRNTLRTFRRNTKSFYPFNVFETSMQQNPFGFLVCFKSSDVAQSWQTPNVAFQNLEYRSMFGLLAKLFSEIIPETLAGVIWWN